MSICVFQIETLNNIHSISTQTEMFQYPYKYCMFAFAKEFSATWNAICVSVEM